MTTNQLKQKILYVITQGEWGGAQRYVYDLATNLIDNFDVTVAVGEPKGGVDLQEKITKWNGESGMGKVDTIQLKHLIRRISPIHDILAIFELAKLYKKLKPDIIHLNSTKAGILGSLAKFTTSTTLQLTTIYTAHGWIFNEPNRKLGRALYRWLEKITARWKDKIIVLSDFDYAAGQRAGIPVNKLVKIPLGIDTPKFLSKNEAREALAKITNYKLQITNFVVGAIANLYPTKGLDTLVEAIRLLVDKERDSSTSRSLSRAQSRDFARNDSDVKFVIIGEGPERKKLKNLIKKYKLEQIIHLVGAVENAAQYLRAFDLFVLPSRKEGLPYTILEAVAANTPIIATNVGGIPSLITSEKTCLLVEPDNAKALAEVIHRAMNNPDEAKRRAERASEKTQKFTLEKMLLSTSSLYSSARHS